MPRPRIRWKPLLVTLGVALLAIQLVPYGHSRTNPPIAGEPQWDSIDTKLLAKRACYDCHSNETEWPAYSRVAPASWLVTRHVREGREHLNFSEMNRPQKEADEAAEKVRDGEMPMQSYTLMHAHARLTDEERAALAAGLAKTFGADE